ncbi:hypothetical protein OHA25_44355 [Nonomuraea sp. NBC_00507]|uniref:hypothetical protein n=1 Tax=Nonomuraea sp. NBC_00507 TaxID=2976002 RepID=UPI002E19A266
MTCTVAVPVLDCDGRPIAAVGAVVHTVRVEPAKLAPPILLAAEGIAARLDCIAGGADGAAERARAHGRTHND